MGASNKRCSLRKNENFTQKTNKQTNKQKNKLLHWYFLKILPTFLEHRFKRTHFNDRI